jgi:hypothetical protein
MMEKASGKGIRRGIENGMGGEMAQNAIIEPSSQAIQRLDATPFASLG